MTTIQLKECPFCGGMAIPISDDDMDFYVMCTTCLARGAISSNEIPPYPHKYPNEKEKLQYAVSAWNKRKEKDNDTLSD